MEEMDFERRRELRRQKREEMRLEAERWDTSGRFPFICRLTLHDFPINALAQWKVYTDLVLLIGLIEALLSRGGDVVVIYDLTAEIVWSSGSSLLYKAALVVNVQRTSSDVHAKLEQQGARFNS